MRGRKEDDKSAERFSKNLLTFTYLIKVTFHVPWVKYDAIKSKD